MIHHFDTEVAERLGINQAIILYNLGLMQTQRAIQGGDEYFRDGRWWVRHSYESLAEWHKFLSVPQIKRVMKGLIEQGHVVTWHPERFNRTTYWSVAPEFLHSAESHDGKYEIVPSESTKSYFVQHDNNIEHIGHSSTKRFKPPTLAEVSAYCADRNNGIDAQRFIDYYEARGWYSNKTKIKDWQACVRTWERNSKSKGSDTFQADYL